MFGSFNDGIHSFQMSFNTLGASFNVTYPTPGTYTASLVMLSNMQLQHLRQLRTFRTALIVHAVRDLLGQSAVISSSQAMILASRPRFSMRRLRR